MLSKALRTKRCTGLIAFALLVISGVVWRGWTARLPLETALRSDLVLREGVLYRAAAPLPFKGVIVEDWRAGQRRVEVTIVDGRAHGLSRGWYENGQIRVQSNFEHGKKEGIETAWNSDGSLKYQTKYHDGQEIRSE